MRNSSKIAAVFIFALFILSSIFVLYAAEPSGDEVGPQAERFRMQAERERETLEKKSKPPKVVIDEKKAVVSEGPAFLLQGIKPTGNAIVKTEDLAPIYQSYLGKQITFSDLETMPSLISCSGTKTLVVRYPFCSYFLFIFSTIVSRSLKVI